MEPELAVRRCRYCRYISGSEFDDEHLVSLAPILKTPIKRGDVDPGAALRLDVRVGVVYFVALAEDPPAGTDEFAEDVLDLLDQEEVVELKLPKIPFTKVQQAFNFFRIVKRKHGTEALLRIYYDPVNDDFALFAPKQEVSTCYVTELELAPIPDGHYLVGVIHSHPDKPFHSSTLSPFHKLSFDISFKVPFNS